MDLEEAKKISFIQSYLHMLKISHSDKPETTEFFRQFAAIKKKYDEKKEIPTLSELELLLNDLQDFVERAEGIKR